MALPEPLRLSGCDFLGGKTVCRSGIGGELISAGDLLLPGRTEAPGPLAAIVKGCPFDAMSVSPGQVCLRPEAILGSGAYANQ